MTRDTRKTELLDAAVALATRHGYMNVTRHMIAERAGVTPALVPYYFGTMNELRRAIMSEAIRVRALRIIAQGIADGHPKAKRAPDELKREAVMSLVGGV